MAQPSAWPGSTQTGTSSARPPTPSSTSVARARGPAPRRCVGETSERVVPGQLGERLRAAPAASRCWRSGRRRASDRARNSDRQARAGGPASAPHRDRRPRSARRRPRRRRRCPAIDAVVERLAPGAVVEPRAVQVACTRSIAPWPRRRPFERGQHLDRRLAAVERLDQRLLDGHRAVEGARVAPALEECASGTCHWQYSRGLVVVEAEVDAGLGLLDRARRSRGRPARRRPGCAPRITSNVDLAGVRGRSTRARSEASLVLRGSASTGIAVAAPSSRRCPRRR